MFCLAGSRAVAQFGAVKEGVKKAGEATVETDKATVKANACKDHGGVKAEARPQSKPKAKY